MITATRISRALGILGVAGFLAHATTSLATSGASYQEPAGLPEPAPAAAPAADAAPLPSAPEPLKDLPPAPEEPALDLADLPAAAPAPKAEAPAEIKAEVPPSAAPAPAPAEEPNPLPPARELTSKPALAPAVAPPDAPEDHPTPKASRRAAAPREEPADDPDAHARSFVERNRREAEEQLKALRDEAAQLKGRLARVEAGIRRWEALAAAMNQGGQDRAAVATGADSRLFRSRGTIQYGVPVPAQGGVIIQSQPVTRSDFVPVPGPR